MNGAPNFATCRSFSLAIHGTFLPMAASHMVAGDDAFRQLAHALQEIGLHVAAAARRVRDGAKLLLVHLARDEERIAQVRVGHDEIGAGPLGLHDQAR